MDEDENASAAETDASPKEELNRVEIPEVEIEKPGDKVWYYLTFYKDGRWSFQKKSVDTEEVEYEFPIMNSMKRERMLMAYENGRVNVVIPYEILKPKGIKGRKLKTTGKKYKNGWNTKSRILNIFSAKDRDLILFKSKDDEGAKWIKIHHNSAISEHASLGSEGNVLVNEKRQAKPLQVVPLPLEYFNLISSLVLKDHQTSGYLGYKVTDRNLKNTFKALEQLIGRYGLPDF